MHLIGAAAYSGDEDAVRLLAGRDGAQVDEGSPVEGATAAVLAADKGHLGCLRALCENGANLNKAALNGCTPVCAAAQQGHVDCVRFLKEAGCDMSTPERTRMAATPVYAAASCEGHVDCVRFLKEAGCDMSTPDNNGCTPVYAAAHQGHVDCVRFLKEAGCDMSTPANNGCTPVYAAAARPCGLCSVSEGGWMRHVHSRNGHSSLAAQEGHWTVFGF